MRNVVIVGSGVAGYTAAIYTARANLSPLLVSGTQLGGQLTITTEVENFPGWPEGVLGPELMQRCEAQAKRFGTEIVSEEVASVDLKPGALSVTMGNGRVEIARTIIVATGASARWLGLASEERLRGKGVSGCATCDGFFFKGKNVMVVGGGDTALEDASFLTKFANRVTVVHRRNEFRASAYMVDRCRRNEKMAFAMDSVVEDIVGESKVEGVRLRNVKTGATTELACDGVFVAIGHSPNTGFLKGHLELDENGYVKTDGYTRTSASGVFAAGDCADPRYRQAIVAAGSGCMAALEAEKFLGQG